MLVRIMHFLMSNNSLKLSYYRKNITITSILWVGITLQTPYLVLYLSAVPKWRMSKYIYSKPVIATEVFFVCSSSLYISWLNILTAKINSIGERSSQAQLSLPYLATVR